MEIRSKIWLEIKGEPVFGSGRQALLQSIDRHGSINQAAKDIHISYRKALSYIQNMEKRLGIKMVKRKIGGRHGGGATLTKKAQELIDKYERLEHGINRILDRRYAEVFGKNNKNK
jgi:molybdate transport system regulatory protein